MEIKSLPFFYKSHPSNDNGGLPHTMPFFLYYDEEIKLLRQSATNNLLDILKSVYIQGSLVDGSVSSESGLHYVDPIVKYILANGELKKESKILEIGFGAGIFLRELKNYGFDNLTGIEPGNHNKCEGLEEVRLISDFYPSKKYDEKVDLIFHCLVLEHIQDPIMFLNSQKLQLTNDGKIIFFVPNEEPFLESGDCSSFIHEHFNFFTTESIFSLAKKIGMYIQDITIIEGLFAVTLAYKPLDNLIKLKEKEFDYQNFIQKTKKNLELVSIFLNQYPFQSDIALYVPARALNAMYLLNFPNARLVDDSSEVHGKYLPFFTNSIESFQSLLHNPPRAILIFSRTFGNKIKLKCESYLELKDCKIVSLDDIINV
jgi:SAM-dependent methyltransferase